MSEIIIKNGAADRILQKAQEKGYATPEEYLLDLVEADELADEDSDTESLASDFKEAFKDAVKGKFFTKEEYRAMRSRRD